MNGRVKWFVLLVCLTTAMTGFYLYVGYPLTTASPTRTVSLPAVSNPRLLISRHYEVIKSDSMNTDDSWPQPVDTVIKRKTQQFTAVVTATDETGPSGDAGAAPQPSLSYKEYRQQNTQKSDTRSKYKLFIPANNNNNNISNNNDKKNEYSISPSPPGQRPSSLQSK